jgi:hypothetical protein
VSEAVCPPTYARRTEPPTTLPKPVTRESSQPLRSNLIESPTKRFRNGRGRTDPDLS